MSNTLHESLEANFVKHIQDVFRTLLQEKHLYQSVVIEPDKLINPILEKETDEHLRAKEQVYFNNLIGRKWDIYERYARASHIATAIERAKYGESYISFQPPDVKLFCNTCKRIEAFNLLSVAQIYDESASAEDEESNTIQVFSLSYLCQSCKTTPDVFLIRRDGFRLTLSGRTPIEYVDVPKVIPKPIGKFYSGALVAHQSGYTLAGNFYLRTLLEQWARSITNDSAAKADIVMEKYSSTLPEDFRQRFVSMRDLYGRLSEDIHNVKGSHELFDTALKQIEEHFEARKLYKLEIN